MGSEEYFETKQILESTRDLLCICKEDVNKFEIFDDLRTHIDIALDEVRRLEREEF